MPEQATRVATSVAHLLGLPQQLHHGSALGQEESQVTAGLRCPGPGVLQGLKGLRSVSLHVLCQGLQHADLEQACGAT
jgi:hypothetical protein